MCGFKIRFALVVQVFQTAFLLVGGAFVGVAEVFFQGVQIAGAFECGDGFV